ncbi:MAG: S-layer homology domain-containing protein [Actinomycetota bacterium]|nr:S-layer homology domain-containing protein [Actinomycetota bacterium]
MALKMVEVLPAHVLAVRKSALSTFLVAVVVLAFALPAAATSDPYAEDPNGLVPFRESGMGVYSTDEDVWEVWVCDVPGWSVALDATSLTAQLNDSLSSYFVWLSGGAYRPVFKAGGSVSSSDFISSDLGSVVPPTLTGCEQAVSDASSSRPEGVLIVADGGYGWGYGTPGLVCIPPFGGCDYTYPANLRRVVLGAGSVAVVPPFSQPRLTVVAHEIGHALGWAHSYGGAVTLPDGSVNEYDNIVDVMSGYELIGVPIGTHAYNRYASGWIEPWEISQYEGGTHTYRLRPIGGAGNEMVAIPLAEGYTYTFGLRDLTAWDADLAKAGVEAYLVDVRATACEAWPGWPAGYPCWGIGTRIAPTPNPSSTTDTSHVLGIGDAATLGAWQLSVLVDQNGTYLRITDGQYLGRFVDDDGNPHETNIEAIAAMGVTQGCDPPSNDRYCPSTLVSRAAMAAFLVRSLNESVKGWDYKGYFADVSNLAWHAPYVERLYELGITTGYADGTYRPDGAVSRAEMAVFVARAFGLPLNAQLGSTFEDVTEDAWYASHVGALLTGGVTKGCSSAPLLYCPQQAVPRDQMGSFLARALGIGA